MQRNDPPHGDRLLDGRVVAADLRRALTERAASLRERGVEPRLAVLLVGDDPASHAYTATIARTGSGVGVHVEPRTLPAGATQAEVAAALAEAARDDAVHGVVLQQPLPPHLSAPELVAAIPSTKDVDGASPPTLGRLAFPGPAPFAPATPRAVMELLRRSTAWPPLGLEALVVGKSTVVGLPVALLLLGEGATVTVAHRDTVDLRAHLRRARVVVTATGVPGLIDRRDLLAGATVVDVGTTVVGDRLAGDLGPPDPTAPPCEYTPVPGGVGPVTTATLLANVVEAAERQDARSRAA